MAQFFKGNYGSALGSTANAANLIAQAGQAQGQMFANLGRTISSSVEKFRENKAKKEKEEAAANLFIRNYENNPGSPIFEAFGIKSSEEAKAVAKDISKDPALVNQAMQFAQNQFIMNQRKQADMLTRGKQQFAQATLGTTPQKVQPSDSKIRDFFRQEKANEKAKGLGSITNPEEFRRRAVEMSKSGQLNPAAQQMAANQFMQMKQANAPQPRSIQDEIAIRKEIRDQKKFDDDQAGKKPKPPAQPIYMESALEAIDDALELAENDSFYNPTVGFGSETMANIGGTDAADLQAALETITSAVGFKRLQDMREASPTGGALGAVSERELSQLNAALGSIKQRQSKPKLLKNLKRIQKHYRNSVNAINAQRLAFQQGKSFKTEQEALDFINSQNKESGIQTDQGNYQVRGLSITPK